MIPFSELGKLRRAMIEQLDASLAQPGRERFLSVSRCGVFRRLCSECVKCNSAMLTLAVGMQSCERPPSHAHDKRGHGTDGTMHLPNCTFFAVRWSKSKLPSAAALRA